MTPYNINVNTFNSSKTFINNTVKETPLEEQKDGIMHLNRINLSESESDQAPS